MKEETRALGVVCVYGIPGGGHSLEFWSRGETGGDP